MSTASPAPALAASVPKPGNAASPIPAASASPAKGSEAGGDDGDASQPRQKKRRLGVDPSLILADTGRSRRRKTPTPGPEDGKVDLDPKDPKRATELGRQIYDRIMASKDADGESMADPFIQLPNKRQFPDYYEMIHKPMSLDMVDEKLRQEAYQTLKEVCVDIGQIFNNAKRYNIKESLIFQYAKKLHKMTRVFYSSITSPDQKGESDSEHEQETEVGHKDVKTEEPRSVSMVPKDSEDDIDMGGPSNSVDGDSSADPASRLGKKRGSYMKDGPTVYKLIKPVLKLIRDAKSKDGTGREISGIFEELPDTKDFEDYYKVIKNPIALSEIEDRMNRRKYEKWEEFFDDVDLMINNAMIYNEDESEVFKDAEQIRDILEQARIDTKERLSRPQVPVSKVKVAKPATPSGSAATPMQYVNAPTPSRLSASVDLSPAHMQYPPLPVPSVPPPAVPYLPALPPGVVTEDIVASLAKYPAYEQQAWANSLPPLALQIYRQMAAANEARKRGHVAPPPRLADGPSAARPVHLPQMPGTPVNGSGPVQRPPPPEPTIKHVEFTFSSTFDENPFRPTVRLYNLKGVITHAVMVGADTSEIELTAYTSSTHRASTATGDAPTTLANGKAPVVEAIESVPELSLRVNGNQGALPKYVFDGGQTDAIGGVEDKNGQRPNGMRWTISMPTSRMESKIEVIATKPGALAETSTIFVNRQY